ncbi:MAG: autoinducer binding domain-containing protein [Alphaproteobacteria bacterium]|nr:autoinducer binding domain-containing protein [Alphaproteobacteria bacterium]
MVNVLATAERKPFTTFEEATAYLDETVRVSGVKHLSYWNLQFTDGMPEQVIWVATYDPNYMNEYMKNFTPLGDPVMTDLRDGRIVDWNEWAAVDEALQSIHAAADRYDIPKFGISMHLPAQGNDKIVFSVCMDAQADKWPDMRGTLVNRFKPFAYDFHARMTPMIMARQKGDGVYAF